LQPPGLPKAQVTVDVTKVNCDQFVHYKISEPRLIAAWLSGYYNAKRNNRVIDLQTLEENMSKVTNYIMPWLGCAASYADLP